MRRQTSGWIFACAALLALNGFCEVRRAPRIVAFGDSITEGTIGIRPEENWLRLLQAKFGERAVMFNAGVGGNSAREAMARFDRDVLAHDPDVVLIEFGGNNHDPDHPERRVKDDEFRAHLETFRSRLPVDCRVVAVTFPPVKDEWHAYGRHANFPDGLDAAMAPQRQILREVASQNGWALIDLYEMLKPQRESVLLSDGVHLNPKGQRIFAEAVEKVLRKHSLLDPVPVITGPEAWGGRRAHPAVVNPVTGQDPSCVLSLRGEWDFRTDDNFGRSHPYTHYDWMTRPWTKKIQVPGCWESQGIGDPGQAETWSVLNDSNGKPIRHKFMGVGRYRRRVTIPADWAGKRIWLKVGGAKAVVWFHVDKKAIAYVDSFCGTYKYDITDLVTPGKESVFVAQVRNDVPSRKGLFSAMHRWGGLYRDVELEATPETVSIDDAWVRGDFDRRTAEAHVEVNRRGLNGFDGFTVRFSVEGRTTSVPLGDSGEVTLTQELKDFRPWSPEHPNLYTGLVELVANGRVIQSRRERFGIRKLEVRGKEFYLNGKPFYFRAYGDDHVYPICGLTPADANEHRKHLTIARAAGFNALRFHTHVEVPEFFEAADELGIMIEAELPYYNDEPSEDQVFDPHRDVTELWKHYRRYPSFCVYSMGNEGTFGDRLDRELHRYVKAMDPDRIKINQDGNLPEVNSADRSDVASGPTKEWPRGSHNPDRPFVAHEYLNLGGKLDSRLEPAFTGVWLPPVTRKGRLEWLSRFGLDLAWGDRLQDAAHQLQGIYQKKGIESARTDPYCDGHCFWTIVDVVVANSGTYSAQGLFNPFWKPKEKGCSAKDFAVFNSPVGVFLDVEPASRIFVSGDKVGATARLANYGDAVLKSATLAWTLATETETLVQGRQDVGDLAFGAVRQIADFSFAAPGVGRPVRASLSLVVSGVACASVSNSWNCWIFPKRGVRDGSRLAIADTFVPALGGRYEKFLPETQAEKADVVIAPYGSSVALDALGRGQKVIALAKCEGSPNVQLGWWSMGSQVGTAFLDHPALAGLPHQGILNELFFRILKKGETLPLEGISKEGLIGVGEGGIGCFGYLAEARSDKGAALLSFGLDVLSPTPEGAALLDGMIDYVRSGAFEPTGRHRMPRVAACNGVSRVLKAGIREKQRFLSDEMNLYGCRGKRNVSELEWETEPVPKDVGGSSSYDFRFFGGQGYPDQPPVSFSLFVNGVRAIDIPGVSWDNKVWTQGEYRLAYTRDSSTAEFGTYVLTVPKSCLEPGRACRIKVCATEKNSRQWFAIVTEK